MTEIERQKKVISMMITGHSVLRARYFTLAAIFDNILLISSVILNSLVFVDSKLIERITHIDEESQRVIIGCACILVFAISVLILQVKWKEKAENHSKAVEHFFILLQECRAILELPEGEQKGNAINQFHERYTQVSNTLVEIPDSMFNYLKLKHYRKIELSKLIEKYPGSRLVFLQTKLFLSSFKEKN